mmetsp:Transcript_19254/g.56123  ORF Transcript_19254/g.56123 Transcript_19254/m.56123 type:complete len:637 (-) Transcript_19254:13-1923(-)
MRRTGRRARSKEGQEEKARSRRGWEEEAEEKAQSGGGGGGGRGFVAASAAALAVTSVLLCAFFTETAPRPASAFVPHHPSTRAGRTGHCGGVGAPFFRTSSSSRRRVASRSPPPDATSSSSEATENEEKAKPEAVEAEAQAPPPPPTTTEGTEEKKKASNNNNNKTQSSSSSSGSGSAAARRMELSCCNRDSCATELREVVVGAHNSMVFTGPATGQVVYGWTETDGAAPSATNGVVQGEDEDEEREDAGGKASPPTVLLLIKRDDDELMGVAAEAIKTLMSDDRGRGAVRVLLDAEQASRLRHDHGVDDSDGNIGLFDPALLPDRPVYDLPFADATNPGRNNMDDAGIPDLVVTLGGDGLLMYASSLFVGPCPPILCVAGGSLGFLTPFSKDEMVAAIESALGLRDADNFIAGTCPGASSAMYDTDDEQATEGAAAAQADLLSLHSDDDEDLRPQICLSMRMRLECTIVDRDGMARDEFCVLNEVAIDRGSSPYLANLECYCDGTHLTTIQADGVIFATPTGSTAYSMAAGGSVIHPAVPAILVTPICPHVLSFRPMVLPDHVVLRCFVPDDARSAACVSFDGKERQELLRGESIQICMSHYPVPTINRVDHSSDWLGSLKRNFNFNTRVRQNPL